MGRHVGAAMGRHTDLVLDASLPKHKKLGRPKLGRDGAPIKNKKPKKKKNMTDFIDNNLTVHKSVSIQKISTKKRGRPPKTNSNTSNRMRK